MVVKVVVVTVGGRSEPAQSWKGVEALTTSNPLNRTEQQQIAAAVAAPSCGFFGEGEWFRFLVDRCSEATVSSLP